MNITYGCLRLPGLDLCPGYIVLLRLSRGEAIRGVFSGFGYGFIALAGDCSSPPNRFVNVKRLVEVVVLGECVQERGNG